jgi:twitching motility protein PilT
MNTLENDAQLLQLFEACDRANASDIHVAMGEAVYLRAEGELKTTEQAIDEAQLQQILVRLVGETGLEKLRDRGSVDGAIGVESGNSGFHRYRYNIYQSSGKTSIAFRKLESEFRSLRQLGLPDQLLEVTSAKDGLVLVAGPTGSGKSTTLATLIDHINQNQSAHIITIEDPVEFVHRSVKSRVTQRQVGLDTPSFSRAVFDAVRQDPDILLVGELRDLETIKNAIEVALTGHLVFATVHAGDTVGAIERVVNVFPGDQQPLIQQMLSSSLRAIVAQHLLPSSDGGRVLASEVLYHNSAVGNLIRTSNVGQIRSVLETGGGEGMYTLDACLSKLVQAKKIVPATARTIARNPKFLSDLRAI